MQPCYRLRTWVKVGQCQTDPVAEPSTGKLEKKLPVEKKHFKTGDSCTFNKKTRLQKLSHAEQHVISSWVAFKSFRTACEQSKSCYVLNRTERGLLELRSLLITRCYLALARANELQLTDIQCCGVFGRRVFAVKPRR